MKKLTTLIIMILMISLVTGCGGSQHFNGSMLLPSHADDLPINDTAISVTDEVPDEETGKNNENDDSIELIPSIDYRDYSIIINDYDVDYGIYNNMTLSEFPLDVFIAWCLGSDGAYAAAANHVLFDRFLSDPDELLEYMILIGDEIIHDDYAKVWLCRKLATEAVSRNEFEGNVRISLPEIIDNLMEKYQSGDKTELLSLILGQYDSYIKENFG